MDKRKLKQASVDEMQQQFDRDDVLNSESVNRAFLRNAELVFELEKELKLKAQLRYLEEVQKKRQSKGLLSGVMQH